MKMENVSFQSLLSAYLKENYPADEDVLVVYWDYDAETGEGIKERRALENTLTEFGCGIPNMMNIPDAVLISGLQFEFICKLVSDFHKASFRLKVWRDGRCINENR